jgi:hypothetical protein
MVIYFKGEDMSEKVIRFNGITKLDIKADVVLDSAMGVLDSAVVVGWDKDGQFYFGSSIASGPEVVWLLELAKKKLLEIAEDQDLI